MENITHLTDLLHVFGKYSFLFATFIEPISLMKSIPNSISSIFEDPQFTISLQETSSSLEQLIRIIKDNQKLIKNELSSYKPSKDDFPYADFSIDDPPIIKDISPSNRLDVVYGSFTKIIEEKHVLPVRRRQNSFDFKGNCPFCAAPHDYVYDNNGRGQLKCKVCENTFHEHGKRYNSTNTPFFCPHCNAKLNMKHDREGYKVYSCNNKRCSFYLNNLELVKTSPELLATSSNTFKLHYYFRDFKFSLNDLDYYCQSKQTKVNFSKIYFDHYTLGLVLTYRINYGMSARKTVAILRDIHGIKISHQTVMNYTNTASSVLKSFVDTYPYDLGESLTGDETYVKIKGKNHYVFFFSDPEKKIITSYNIFERRTTREACQAIYESFCKYKVLPEDLLVVTDANPIYNAAQVFFKLNNFNFNLKQVIGLNDNDADSWFFRPLKQIQERLNRTFKASYSGMNGFNNIEKANSYMVLFVAFFNFLRHHSGLNHRCPVEDNLFNADDLMPFKWLKLI